jgi:molybdopterin-biosynthesis enzyme MoeA-like protein
MGRRRHTEPSLDELFADVAIQLLMQRDGVTESEIRALLAKVEEAQTTASANSLPHEPVSVSTRLRLPVKLEPSDNSMKNGTTILVRRDDE